VTASHLDVGRRLAAAEKCSTRQNRREINPHPTIHARRAFHAFSAIHPKIAGTGVDGSFNKKQNFIKVDFENKKSEP